MMTILLFAAALAAEPAKPAAAHPQVTLETSKGTIVLELYPEKAPKTVENFLAYVKAGHYSGTVFHRVIPGFMVQGGGFGTDGQQKATKPPITPTKMSRMERSAARRMRSGRRKLSTPMARTQKARRRTAVDVSRAIADSRDVVDRAVRVRGVGRFSGSVRVTEDHLALRFQLPDGLWIC